MGHDYALVHIKYTIPPGIALTLLYRPFLQRIDLYKIVFLITIAVLSATPWDSYLIRSHIWTYPPQAVLGFKLFLIPLEEVFFFIIQTYNTTLLYLIVSKPLLHARFLGRSPTVHHVLGRTIQLGIGMVLAAAMILLHRGGEATYLALILVWALPFVLMLWTLSFRFLLQLPLTSTLVPIALPTLYLWVVDTLALQRGTWTIETGTKLGIYLWHGLEIEEAIFFLTTNTLVVFGLVAFDHSLAIIQSFPDVFAVAPELPSPLLLIKALLLPDSAFDEYRIAGIQHAVTRLKQKSRSFYLASATFSGRLRIDLILLYSFCRVADDLVDNAETAAESCEWIEKLNKFLTLAYGKNGASDLETQDLVQSYITANFPETSQSALQLLPTQYLSCQPLFELLEGFKTDVQFLTARRGNAGTTFPIGDEQQLEVYAVRVAGTVAELCLELVFHHTQAQIEVDQQKSLLKAGRRMGVALQYVNIARDIETDTAIHRVYLPTSWLKEMGLSHDNLLKQPFGLEVERMRRRVVDMAFAVYEETRNEMAGLPHEARAPLRVAVESYMEIGRVLREKEYRMKNGRATVPVTRRLRVAWKAMMEP